jgi:hypothetical protein
VTARLDPAQMLAVLQRMSRDDQSDNRERVNVSDGPPEPCIAPADLDAKADEDADRWERAMWGGAA